MDDAVGSFALEVKRRWSWGRLLSYVVLVAIVYFATQVIAVIGMLIPYALASPAGDVRALVKAASVSNGVLLSVLSIASAATCVPLVYYLVSRCEAPVAEELLFRGFLYGGFRACGAPIWVTVIVVSSAFAALHTQYDLYDVSHVFLLAFMLMAARVRFDSIVPGVTMHALTNAVGFVEAAVLS